LFITDQLPILNQEIEIPNIRLHTKRHILTGLPNDKKVMADDIMGIEEEMEDMSLEMEDMLQYSSAGESLISDTDAEPEEDFLFRELFNLTTPTVWGLWTYTRSNNFC
jgi:hypothetical protein